MERLRVRLISMVPVDWTRQSGTEPKAQLAVGLDAALGVVPVLDVGPVPQPPEEEVEDVGAKVGEHATARHLLLQEEVGGEGPAGNHSLVHLEAPDLAQEALPQEVADEERGVEEAELQSHGEQGPARVRGGDHGVALTDVQGHGLLHQHVDALAQEVDRHRGMKTVGQGHDGGVHPARQAANVGSRLGNAEAGREIPGAAGIGVHEHHSLGAPGEGERRQVVDGGDGATPHHG